MQPDGTDIHYVEMQLSPTTQLSGLLKETGEPGGTPEAQGEHAHFTHTHTYRKEAGIKPPTTCFDLILYYIYMKIAIYRVCIYF